MKFFQLQWPSTLNLPKKPSEALTSTRASMRIIRNFLCLSSSKISIRQTSTTFPVLSRNVKFWKILKTKTCFFEGQDRDDGRRGVRGADPLQSADAKELPVRQQPGGLRRAGLPHDVPQGVPDDLPASHDHRQRQSLPRRSCRENFHEWND